MILATAVALGACTRNHTEAPARPPEPPRVEIPADASIRLITDPMPAQPPPAAMDGASPMIPLNPR